MSKGDTVHVRGSLLNNNLVAFSKSIANYLKLYYTIKMLYKCNISVFAHVQKAR